MSSPPPSLPIPRTTNGIGVVAAPLDGDAGARGRRRGLDHGLGQRGQLANGLVDAGETGEVAPADADELSPPVAAQHALQLRPRQRPRRARRGERRAMRVERPLPLGEQACVQRGPARALGGEGRGERWAPAEHAQEDVWPLDHDVGGGERLERVQRGDGVRRGAQPGQHEPRVLAPEPRRDRHRRVGRARRLGDGGFGQSRDAQVHSAPMLTEIPSAASRSRR